ncbi:MAG: hypothetical protein WC347_01010 [Smithellaceae bacterium]|jgi:hypothetical protein
MKRLLIISVILALFLPVSGNDVFKASLRGWLNKSLPTYAYSLNQGVATTDSPTFAGLTLTGTLSASNVTASPTLSVERIINFAGWTPTAGWTYGSGKWTHSSGTTALVATGETALVSGTKYEVTITVTHGGVGSDYIYLSAGGATFGTETVTLAHTTIKYNFTCTSTTTALTFSPSTGWTGSINSASVKTVSNGQLTAEGIALDSGQISLNLGSSTYPGMVFYNGPDTFSFGVGIGGRPTFFSGSTFVWGYTPSDLYLYSGKGVNFAADLFLSRDTAATLQLGTDSSATTTNQKIKAMDRTGTNAVGANLTLAAGNSTGSGAGGSFVITVTPASGSGVTPNAEANAVEVDSTLTTKFYGASSQSTNIKQATVAVTTTAAATVTASNLIPAGSMVVGVTTRVTTAVTGDAGFTGINIGDGTDPDRWGANVSPLINETTDLTDCTVTTPPIYASATSIVLTQVGGSTFVAGGVVRVTVHYISLTAPIT